MSLSKQTLTGFIIIISTVVINQSSGQAKVIGECGEELAAINYDFKNYSAREAAKIKFVNEVNAKSHIKGIDGSGISAAVLRPFDTIIQYPSSGLHSPNAKISILALSGNGSFESNSDGMRATIRTFGDASGDSFYAAKTLTRRLRNEPNFVQADVISVDAPMHRYGADGNQINTPESVGEYWASVAKWWKGQTGNPLMVLARSSSPAQFFYVAKKYPGLIDGFTFLNPMVPGDASMQRSLKDLYGIAERSGEFRVNPISANWVVDILSKITWDENSVGDTPTLILTGSDDEEVRPDERDHIEQLSFLNHNIKYVDFPHASHDLLREYPGYGKREIQEAMKYIVAHENKVIVEAQRRRR